MRVPKPLDKILWDLCRDTREDVEEIVGRVEKLRRRVIEDLSLTNHPFVLMHLREFQKELERMVRNDLEKYLNPSKDGHICSKDMRKSLEFLETKLAMLEKKLGLVREALEKNDRQPRREIQ
ncbi:MAG TPA: hypothetical protein VNL13_07105 [Sulfolobales archaeon]|nr:hypothetical protein [Sulfolobales archaeon]